MRGAIDWHLLTLIGSSLGMAKAVQNSGLSGLASARPFALAVLFAASTSYACPIGYATNLMVLGPGDYSFRDFLRVGLIMDIIYLVCCSLLIPVIWPLELV